MQNLENIQESNLVILIMRMLSIAIQLHYYTYDLYY